jgi:hypothetical protein
MHKLLGQNYKSDAFFKKQKLVRLIYTAKSAAVNKLASEKK